MSEPMKQLDPGSITVVLDESGSEVGVVYVDPQVSTVNEDGQTWQAVIEHWYLYPAYDAPSPGGWVKLQGVNAYHVGGAPFATRAQVESYARQKAGTGAITYEKCRSLRRTL